MRALRLLLFALPWVAWCEDTRRVKPCELLTNPANFDHALVEVTALLSHRPLEFAIFDPACVGNTRIWVEYGGKLASGTAEYCCSPAERKRKAPLEVEGLTIPLITDAAFSEFDHLIQDTPDRMVRATVVGRFFAGAEGVLRDGRSVWGGYGADAAYSLLTIQQVVSVDPQTRTDLDYRQVVDLTDLRQKRCWVSGETRVSTSKDSLAAQKQAEQPGSEWLFEDPLRVAGESLPKYVSRKPEDFKIYRQEGSRVLFQLPANRAHVGFLILVSRPYWLSFYAKDPARVAWVTTGMWQLHCQ